MPFSLDRIYPWARGLTMIYIVFELLYLIHSAFFLRFLTALQAGEPAADREGWAESIDAWGAIIGPGFIIALIAALIVNGMWIYRVSSNAAFLAPREGRITPGWAVGWYFVPIANLWMPFRALKEAWDGSGGPASPLLFGWWWVLWLGGNVLAQFSYRLSQHGGLDKMISATWFDLVNGPVSIVAGVLFLLIIERLTRMQRNHPEAGGSYVADPV